MVELENNYKVYVLKYGLLGKYDLKINNDMFGTIINIDKWEDIDDWGFDINCFKATIQLNNNKKIVIRDGYTRTLFSKYDLVKADIVKELVDKNELTKIKDYVVC